MNAHIKSRLNGLHDVLWSAFKASGTLSSATKGAERETFIRTFLSEVLPPIYRFGTGDVTDAAEDGTKAKRSGQLDIVIEMPWAPSFPTAVGVGPRLYPAEAVGAVIEVKSNVSSQWAEVLSTARALEPLRQTLSGLSVDGGSVTIQDVTAEPVPLFAVGFEGWSTPETLMDKIRTSPLDGLLVIEHRIFVSSDRRVYLRRLAVCQEQLKKKMAGDRFDSTPACCARLVELTSAPSPSTEIVAALNEEGWSLHRTHFWDRHFLPEVQPGKWTLGTLEEAKAVFLLKTKVWEGAESLLQFIGAVHAEVSKRAAMSFRLSEYATGAPRDRTV